MVDVAEIFKCVRGEAYVCVRAFVLHLALNIQCLASAVLLNSNTAIEPIVIITLFCKCVDVSISYDFEIFNAPTPPIAAKSILYLACMNMKSEWMYFLHVRYQLLTL